MRASQAPSDNDVPVQNLSKLRRYVPFALGCIPLNFPPRRLAIRVAGSAYFSSFMMGVIFVNALLLSLYDPVDLSSPLNAQLDVAEVVFLVLFTAEMCVFVLAEGLVWEGAGTYLRSPWHELDFVIVVFGWIALGLVQGQVATFASAARLLRLLRPLRVIRSIPRISWMVKAILRSLPALGSAILVLFTFFVIAGVIALNFFRGALRQRCVWPLSGAVFEPDVLYDRYCSLQPLLFGRQCPAGTMCVVTSQDPPLGPSFDNFPVTLVALFAVVTLQRWTDLMYNLADTHGQGVQAFFIVVVCIGTYVMLNVFVAVLAVNVTVQHQVEEASAKLSAEDRAAARELREQKALLGTVSERTDLYRRRRLGVFLRRHHIKRPDSAEMRLMLSYERMHRTPDYRVCSAELYSKLAEKHQGHYAKWKALLAPILDFNERLAAAHRRRVERETWLEQNSELAGAEDAAVEPFEERPDRLVTPPFIVREIEAHDEAVRRREQSGDRNLFVRADSLLAKVVQQPTLVPALQPWGQQEGAAWWTRNLFRVVESRPFNACMYGMVVLSTLVLCVEFFDQPEWMFGAIYVSNVVFVAVFVTEMAMRVPAYGPRQYFGEFHYCFDGLVALAGVAELLVQNQSEALALILRVLRVFRIFRLLRPW
jgi:hypothetical protein